MKQNRVDAVLQNLEQMGLSQMLITDPLAIFYLTGRMIQPLERFYGLYLNRRGGHKIFINLLETVPEDLGVEKVRFSDTDPVLDLVAAAVDSREPLGVDKNLPARFLLPLIERGAAGGFVNASLAIDRARAVKDEQERALMRRASQLNDMALEQLRPWITAGVSELELAERLTKLYRELGADGTSFDPLVAFGANAASGHHWPDDTRLQPGDVVLIDAGCIYKGYCSDMTRTYVYQRATDRQRQVYEVVRRANEAAEQAVRPGVPLRELDQIARDIITEAGFGPQFTHRLGHFIGLEDHEFGDVSASAADAAAPGNVFSIEPGVYLAGELGVRIEDLVLVTETGCEILNALPKELEIIG
ncbi:MAG TPA: aminopeptidase P family protein [Candidatus Avoscillospira avicola]|uniref:Aminopeptidase P family protein n=1 Tax=Candidatus Avoscillospira avicola TaxID=2840706 RepID=A0A9D1AQ63_9FIRM|nr:aminopeptidase P family protein [Candidatus Avoscillospira avicola]